jgi:hypothetical protein
LGSLQPAALSSGEDGSDEENARLRERSLRGGDTELSTSLTEAARAEW